MNTQHTLRLARCLGLATTVAALCVLAAEFPQAQTPGQIDPLISAQDRAQCLGAAGVRTARHLKTGTIRFVGTEAGRPIRQPKAVAATASAEVAARSYLSACGSLFGLTDQANELSLMRSKAVGAGRSVVRFQQTQDGVPIIGAELIVHLDSARNVLAVAGETLPKGLVSARAAVDADAALQMAVRATAKVHNLDPSELEVTNPALWYDVPALISPFNDAPALVWRMDVTAKALRPIRELVLIDAERGSVALHFNQVETAQDRRTHTANGTPTLPGTLVCNETNPTCTGGTADAIAAHRYAGDTYAFYFTNHGRDSINGAGMPIVSTVHFRRIRPNRTRTRFGPAISIRWSTAMDSPRPTTSSATS